MADIVIADPGAGGANFAVDTISGTSFPYVKLTLGAADQDNGGVHSSNPLPIYGAVGVTSGAFSASTQVVSSLPIWVSQSSAPWSFSQAGTSYITLASSQVALGGGVQYLDGSATTSPTGTALFWAQGAAESTMAVAATSTPLPVFAISSVPHALVGTSMVNVVSSGILSLPLGQISSTIFTDNAAYVPGTSKLSVIGGYYVSTAITLNHSDAGAARVDSTGAFVIAPGSAEAVVSTTPLVRVGIWNDQDQQVSAFGGGQQYTEGAVTTAPTGNALMWKSLVSTMTVVSSSRPLPVNIVSSISLGFTPTGTSFVSLSSSIPLIVAQSTTPWDVRGGVNVSSMSAVASTFAVNIASTFASGAVSSFLFGQNVTISTTPIPTSQGGLDVISYVSVTSAPLTIKNSAGKVYDIWFTNNSTSFRWLKFFNASSASVSTGTTLPLMTFGLPGGTAGASGWLGSDYGYQFSTAASLACTASSATSTDTSAPGTNEVLVMIGYK